MMKKKNLIIVSVLVAIVAVLLVGMSPKEQQDKEIKTISLKKTDLLDSVLVSGTVISSSTENIYSKLTNYPIKEVFVEVGDKVKAGDVLAKLDTASLALDIKQTELNIKNAEMTLKNENTANHYNIQNASNTVESALIELENQKDDYEKTKILYDAGAVAQIELAKVELAMKKAQISYDNAQMALENNQNKSTATTKNNIQIQKVALEKQKKMLNDATIVAPIDGTVTLVNAKENGSAAGLLFIVEDTENLTISTAISEYDIGLIKIGQEVIIKTDSMGDKEFYGTVSQIAPTAKYDAIGSRASSSNVQFDTEITMKNDSSNTIKIGMNVRLTIKLNEKKNVYSVPYDAVVTESDGNEYIYIAGGKKADIIKKIKVQTGMETDMYIEISSAELKDGLKVLTNPKADTAAKR